MKKQKHSNRSAFKYLVRIVGLEEIKVWPPSSRRPATAHRTVTFEGFSSKSHHAKKQIPIWVSAFLVRVFITYLV